MQPDRNKTVADEQAVQKSSHDCRAHSCDWIVGDRVMARNLRQGPDWLPCTVVEVLGPVTYLVETEDGQRWKRHADQLKTWLPFLPTARSEPVSDSVPQQIAEDFSSEPTEDSSETETHTPAEESSPLPDPSSTAGSEMVAPRYPSRNRQPPDRY